MEPGSLSPSGRFVSFSAWLLDRWLLTVTDKTLRIFDTRSGTLQSWEGITVDRISVNVRGAKS